ncbi:hypothetical protein AVEN_218624-1 [Araneus ventricosus]|uniref:Uncharacterized protein n=1 Tax=Araneus ventricosus TaxID=182803 RepID=A0A4Y2JVR5_ARAVE|nr:hypothetical protein AVEN_218624-1 [Araneus ventricosus]
MAIQNTNPSPTFANEVVKIVEEETIVRSNLKSVSDVYSWVEEYGKTSDKKWNLRSSRPSGTRLVCWLFVPQMRRFYDRRFVGWDLKKERKKPHDL